MFNLEEIDLTSTEMENQMLEHFGDQFLEDAMRIVQNRCFTPLDAPVIHEAMCIIVAMYVRKVKNGEININKVYH